LGQKLLLDYFEKMLDLQQKAEIVEILYDES
jgi:hypothetical protein